MTRRANYAIVTAECNDQQLVIRDIGPWEDHLTITNDAENVVIGLAATLNGRRLYYYDSDGERTELVCEGNPPRFSGFRYAAKTCHGTMQSLQTGNDE